MKLRDAMRTIEKDSWFQLTTRGSHRHHEHLSKPGRVMIAGKHSDDLARGTFASILKQAGLKERR